jgi:hypothetical protein
MSKQKKGIGLWLLDIIQILCAGAMIGGPFGFLTNSNVRGTPDWVVKVFLKRVVAIVVGSAIVFVSIELFKRKIAKRTTAANPASPS